MSEDSFHIRQRSSNLRAILQVGGWWGAGASGMLAA